MLTYLVSMLGIWQKYILLPSLVFLQGKNTMQSKETRDSFHVLYNYVVYD